jgi:hypothetical protein
MASLQIYTHSDVVCSVCCGNTISFLDARQQRHAHHGVRLQEVNQEARVHVVAGVQEVQHIVGYVVIGVFWFPAPFRRLFTDH